jgi:hypothetical protein
LGRSDTRYQVQSTALVIPVYFRGSIGTLGSYWLTSSPFALGIPRALGSSDSRPPGSCRQEPSLSSRVLPAHLSGLSQRSSLFFEPKADSGFEKSLLAPLLVPSAYTVYKAPFFAKLTLDVRRPRRGPQRHRSQGLATLSAAFASVNLGGLSQPPTLLGFALQSFSPAKQPGPPFESPFRPYAPVQNLPA